jgi:hypothetical protein
LRAFSLGGNMALRFLSLCVLLFGAFAPLAAAEKPKDDYKSLLELVKKSDPKADFLKLRMAFTKTADYKPYGSDPKAYDKLTEAFEKKEDASAVKLAEALLAKRYVDMKAHFILYRAHTRLGHTKQAKFHRYVFDGLIKSVLKSGDGKKPATAFVVISTDEEYVVLGVLGIRKTSQALVDEKGKKFDRINGIDSESKNAVSLYFNIGTQWKWLEEQFKKGK